MENCVDSLKKRVEELEKKNKELERSKKMLELQLDANENLVKLMKKQMEEKTAFYSNAFQSLVTNLLLKTNEKIVVAIGNKRRRTSIAAD